MQTAATLPPAGGTALAQPQPLPPLRDELKIHPAGNNRDGSPAWHLADPVRNLYFRLGWLELEMLRRWPLGAPQAIADSISQETTMTVDEQDVLQFLGFLQQQQLLRRGAFKARGSLWRRILHGYLFIRLPLVRPEKALRRMLPWVEWLFSAPFLLLTAVAALAGVVLAARQWDNVEAALHGALSWNGALAFAVALILSKCWHELGHAFMATRYGVRVGHMGVALLVMWPMAYTDTGESWKLSQSRHRLSIASAGIMAELMLAAWATLFWSFAPEGNVKGALFFLATTAWVLTVAVNASPFMRFDGYFILSDTLDYPGLHERAGNWAKRWLRWHLLGLEDPIPDNVSPAFARFLTLFAFATWVYRLLLFVGIALVVYNAFFKALGLVLFFIEIVTFVVQPMFRELKIWRARRREIAPARLLRLVAVALALGLSVFLPWSGQVSLHGVMEAGVAQPVYTPYAAQLDKVLVQEGQQVKAGQKLFELVAPVPADEQDKALALSQAWQTSARGAMALDKNGAAKQVVADQMARQYAIQQRASAVELQRLQLVALEDGVVHDVEQTLRPGSWVSPGTRIASVIDTHRWRVKALVSETDLARLRDGAMARVYQQGRWQPLAGAVVTIDHDAIRRLPNLMLAQSHGGPVALNPVAPANELRPAAVWYRVVIEGISAAPVSKEQLVRVDVASDRQSLAHSWVNSVMLMLIQQTGFGKEG
ncbi:TPA: HlyD family efflux transporter periplasmic adaptor subunit [Escherichia coli]